MKPRVIREAPGAWVVTSSASRLVCGTWRQAVQCALNLSALAEWEKDMLSRHVDMGTDQFHASFG